MNNIYSNNLKIVSDYELRRGINTTDWSRLREQVLERDKFTCQRCRCKDGTVDKHHNRLNTYTVKSYHDYEFRHIGLDVHHIIPIKEGGPYTLENLITYCRSCHKIMEGMRRRMMTPVIQKYNIQLPVDMIQKIKSLAIEKDCYPSKIAEEAFTDYLRKNKVKEYKFKE